MILGVLALVLGGFVARTGQAPSHQIFFNGTIKTLGPAGDVEAVYVHQGRIAAIGTLGDVRAQAPWHAKRFNLQGRVLTPGLIEPHTHPLATAFLSEAIDISASRFDTREQIMAALETAAGQPTANGWVIGFGWDPVAIEGLSPPSLAQLDALSPDRPLIILTQMMHEAFANSAALEASGLGPDTPDPHDGYFGRDESGALTGRAYEVTAVSQLMSAIAEPSVNAQAYLLDKTYQRYARAGYTTIGITALVARSRDPMAVLDRVARQARPGVNTVLYTHPHQLDAAIDRFGTGLSEGAFAKVGGLKIWLDGSPFVGGAATAEPYTDSVFNRDVLSLSEPWLAPLPHSDEAVQAYVRQAQEAGVQIAMHAQGERAVQQGLDAIAQVRADDPRPEIMHRMEHLALITSDQIDQATGLNVSLGFFPGHISGYGHRLADIFGPERAARYMPIAQAIEAGAVVTTHGDHPASPLNSNLVLFTPVERWTPQPGLELGRAISAHESLRLMTLGAARQLQLDDEIGSIEVGKRADFTCFVSEAALSVPARYAHIHCGTWVSGRRIDQRSWSLDRLGFLIAAAWGQIWA